MQPSGLPTLAHAMGLFPSSGVRPFGQELPPVPGVYRVTNAFGRVIYTGRAANLNDRIGTGWRSHHSAWKFTAHGAQDVWFEVIHDFHARCAAELAWWETYRPMINQIKPSQPREPFSLQGLPANFLSGGFGLGLPSLFNK